MMFAAEGAWVGPTALVAALSSILIGAGETIRRRRSDREKHLTQERLQEQKADQSALNGFIKLTENLRIEVARLQGRLDVCEGERGRLALRVDELYRDQIVHNATDHRERDHGERAAE